MSIEHLKLLRTTLETSHWVVLEELPGNDYGISGYWKIARPNGDSVLMLAFDGLDDMTSLPIEKAYSCHIAEHKEVSMYFGKISKSFSSELREFIKGLSRVAT